MAELPDPASARLRFRRAMAEDRGALLVHWRRPDVRRFLFDDTEVPEERVAEIVAESERDFAAHGFGLWIFETRENSGAPDSRAVLAGHGAPLAGFCGLRHLGAEGREGDVEILYSLEPELWGQGLVTEAAAAVLDFVFRTTGPRTVFGGFDAPNRASERVLVKLGFHSRETIHFPNGHADPYLRLAAEEWCSRGKGC